MADSDYKIGEMDISQHQQTFSGFTVLVKWCTIGAFALAVLGTIFTTIWYDGVGGPL